MVQPFENRHGGFFDGPQGPVTFEIRIVSHLSHRSNDVTQICMTALVNFFLPENPRFSVRAERWAKRTLVVRARRRIPIFRSLWLNFPFIWSGR